MANGILGNNPWFNQGFDATNRALNPNAPPPIFPQQAIIGPPVVKPQTVQQDQAPQGFRQRAAGLLQGIGSALRNPNVLDQLAIGFSGMSMRPNQALIQQASNRMEQRQELAAKAKELESQMDQVNKTAEYFRSIDRNDLAQAILNNPQAANVILQEYFASKFQPGDKPTADIQNYNVYVEDEIAAGRTPKSFYEFIMARPPSTQNIFSLGADGQIQAGPIPQGYYLDISDPAAGPTLRVIPGGPADIEQKEAAAEAAAESEQQQMQGEQTTRAGNIVLENISKARTLLEMEGVFTPVTGITGVLSRNVPGSVSSDFNELALTIRANIGFDRLQQMREASPSGGALGNVSDGEIARLESVLGSLSQLQSKEQLLWSLNRLEQIYTGILQKAQAYPNASEYGFGPESSATSQTSGDPARIL